MWDDENKTAEEEPLKFDYLGELFEEVRLFSFSPETLKFLFHFLRFFFFIKNFTKMPATQIFIL